MSIPVYIVTGFLDAGKTTFLNQMLNEREEMFHENLLIQFESGEEEISVSNPDCVVKVFSKRDLENRPEETSKAVCEAIEENKENWQRVWIEWNGMIPFSQLHNLFLQPQLRKLCKIEKVLHICNAEKIEYLLGRTGESLPEQIANSDLIVLRNNSSKETRKKVVRLLREVNPNVNIEEAQKGNESHLYKKTIRKKENPIDVFFLVVLWGIVLSFLAKPVLESIKIPVAAIGNVFLGIILQAIPFLMIGVLLSSAIQVFIPRKWIEEKFPKSLPLGILVALVGGFCLPVCDCASIPIFKSLVKKGVPLPVAITFMTAAPVINPVVMLSTYYAFGGDISIVFQRVGFGMIAAVIIGLIMGAVQKNHKEALISSTQVDGVMCNCGCYNGAENVSGLTGKLELFLHHAQAEFFNVGKYLVIGTLLASIFQVMGSKVFTTMQGAGGLAISLLIMMIVAFILSLCSSSDAVIARSFANQFPMGGIMGFLVFGAMIDIKNVMMLSSGFSKKFIGKLLLVIASVCFVVILAFYRIGGM
ncbi:permease [Scatolibacter rhodanostii]|uniref:permease n=1 Tax=Scatolibacter rhodanostii TaxID=2014781 RepID=UPI000C07817E|nr:permease [Scatolibacter rhodanostii]